VIAAEPASAPGNKLDSWLRANQRWLFYLGLAFFLVSCFLAIQRGWNYDRLGSQTCDFIAPYSGARCFLHGCNPYDSADLQREYVAAHGNLAALDPRHDWHVLIPVYPPTTFLLLTPLTLVDYPHAQVLWFYSSSVLYCLALGLLVAFVPRHWAAIYFLLAATTLNNANTDFLLGPGNPSAPAIALVALAVWAFYQLPTRWPGVVLLALALAMKPHMAIAVFFFLLLRRGLRKPALLAGVIALAMLAGSAWRLHSTTGNAWRQKFSDAVISGIRPGGTNSPGPENVSAPHILNVQALISVFVPETRRFNLISFALTGMGGVLWLAAFARRGQQADPLLATAGLLCLSLLPLYHRDYDSRLLILTLPPLVLLLRERTGWGIALLAASTPLLFSQTTMHAEHYLNVRNITSLSPLRTALFLREGPLALLALSFLWPLALWFARDASQQKSA
jgi:hypothetical protein